MLPFYLTFHLTSGPSPRERRGSNTLVLYASLHNVSNTLNVSRYTYPADYSRANPEYFQRRLLYFGLVKTWQ